MLNQPHPKSQSWRLRAILIFFLVAACGPVSRPAPAGNETPGAGSSSGESGANPRPSATPIPTATPRPSRFKVTASELNGIEITLWHALPAPANPAVQALINEFNRSNEWGIQARAENYGDYDQVMEAVLGAIENGSPPDVVVAYPYQAAEWNRPRQRLIDLHEYLDDPVWGWDETELADFIPQFQINSRETGKLYSVPGLYSAQMLYYNLTWAQELGFETPPVTPADFRTQACAAAQAAMSDDVRENDGTGGWMISTEYSAVLGWLHAFDAEITPASSAGYAFDTPAVQAAFRFLRELYEQGCAWLPEDRYPEGEFAGRQGLFASGSLANIPNQEAAFADLGSKDEWTVIAYPAARGPGVMELYGPAFHIFKSQPARQLAAWLFIQWMTAPENQARLAQASAWFPVRTTSFEQLGTLPKTYPQWQSAAEMLGQSHSEPVHPSWKVVRWAVSDAASQLFRSYFTLEQLRPMLELLDDTAADFHTLDP